MLTVRAANSAAQSVASLLDNGFLRIYGNDKPASPSDSADGRNLLAELRFGDPAFSESRNGESRAKRIGESVAIGSGIATWFLVLDKNGRPIADGKVIQSQSGEPNCLSLSSISIDTGDMVSISDFDITCDLGD